MRANPPRLTLRQRLVALFVIIFGVTLVGFSAFLYEFFRRNHQEQFDRALYNYAVDVGSSVRVDFFGDVRVTPNLLSQGEKAFPFSLGQSFLQLRAVSGQSVARSTSLGKASLPYSPADLDRLTQSRAIFRTLEPVDLKGLAALPYRYRLISLMVDLRGSYDFVLQVAVPLRLLDQQCRALLTFFGFAIPAVLLIAAAGGLYVSRQALEPVHRMIVKAKEISARDLSGRLPVPEAKDEIRELAATLNELLERLELAFRSQETFVADASHQLKTPLAILRGELDVLRSRARSPGETQAFLDSAAQEVAYLSRLVEDLLLLARVDAGAASLAVEDLRLEEVALEVVSRLQFRALDRGARLAVSLGEAESLDAAYGWRGDRDLIRVLFENLIENAIKYSPKGGEVSVRLESRAGHPVFSVADQGPGIPGEAIPRLFERFRRGAGASTPGWGLGLAIARRIAELHDARVDVESPPGKGSEFRVTFGRG